MDQYVLGERKSALYRETARKRKTSEDEIERVVGDYQALLNGKSWATGPRRSEIIDALGGEELAEAIGNQYGFAFMHDALTVMKEILEAGEGVLVFTSRPAPGLREQLAARLGRDAGEIKWGNKVDPAIFQAVYDLEKGLGHALVSHTADELDELVAARESGLFSPNGLIYVNRNQSHSEKEVRKAGIEWYVSDLRQVEYLALS